MQRTSPIVVVLLALAGSAYAADERPAQLVAALAQAAHNRDLAGFTAHLSLASKRALADAEAARARQVRAQLAYQAALDDRFGKAHAFPPPGLTDRTAILSGMVKLDLIGVQTQTPTRALLQLRTTARGPGGRGGSVGQRGRPMNRALVAIGLLLLLTACPPGTKLNTVTLSPIQVMPSYQEKWYVGTWCGFSGLNEPVTAPAFTAPPDDNIANVSWYGNFKLVVRYSPVLDPNAPQ